MIKAYNETWIKNVAIQHLAKKWQNKNWLSAEQFQEIETEFSSNFSESNFFVKVGLFLFTSIACIFVASFFSLFFGVFSQNDNTRTFSILLAGFCSFLYLYVLENVIKTKKLFHSGTDNALLYAGLGAIVFLFITIFTISEIWQLAFLICVISIIATLRYADTFTTITAFLAFFVAISSLLIKIPIGKSILPFVIILVSLLIYLFIKKYRNTIYYDNCQQIIEFLTLLFIYLGGNYFVVREGNNSLSEIPLPISPQIAFAWLFYFLTFSIPFIYVFQGVKQKDRILFNVGLLAFAGSILTFWHYFAFMPLEWALTIGGLLFIGIAILLINTLKSPKWGLSDEEEKTELSVLENIIITHLTKTSPNSSLEFGNGNFGGGGAGNTY